MKSRLGIVEGRTWATWQLATAALLAALIGMVLGYSGNRSNASSASEGGGLVPLQPATAAPASPSTTTTMVSSPTTFAPGTPPASAGPMVELLPNTTGTGTATTQAFTAGGSWTLGWAFTCVATPTGTGRFAVHAVPASGAPASVVGTSGRSGKDTATGAVTGSVRLEITTDPGCRWAVHVVGPQG